MLQGALQSQEEVTVTLGRIYFLLLVVLVVLIKTCHLCNYYSHVLLDFLVYLHTRRFLCSVTSVTFFQCLQKEKALNGKCC